MIDLINFFESLFSPNFFQTKSMKEFGKFIYQLFVVRNVLRKLQLDRIWMLLQQRLFKSCFSMDESYRNFKSFCISFTVVVTLELIAN